MAPHKIPNFPRQAADLDKEAEYTLDGKKYQGRIVRHDVKLPRVKIVEIKDAGFKIADGGGYIKFETIPFYLFGREIEDFNGFPPQGSWWGNKIEVVPKSNPGLVFEAKVVRDDLFDLFNQSDEMIVRILPDGPFLTSDEYSL